MILEKIRNLLEDAARRGLTVISIHAPKEKVSREAFLSGPSFCSGIVPSSIETLFGLPLFDNPVVYLEAV